MAETPSELQEEVEKLERKHAENPEGRYFVPLANAYRKLGRFEPAESLLRDGLRWHPEYLSAHIVLGRSLADRGAVSGASEEFRYVLSLDPQNLVALRYLAELSLGDGDPAEARRWYAELLAADPMSDEARRALDSLAESPGLEGGEPSAPLPAEAEGSDFAFDDLFPLDEEPVDEDFELPMLEDDGPELVTETIAELYARQGLHARSAGVYRELIRRRGGDPELERRLDEVERMAAGLEPHGSAFEPEAELQEEPAAAQWQERFASPSSRESFGDEAGGEPFAGADAPELEAPAGAVVGPTIRAFLSELAAWRPSDPRAPEYGGTVPAAAEPVPGDRPHPEPGDRSPSGEATGGEGWGEDGGFGEEPAPVGPSPVVPPATAADDDDLESFQSWLRSLKR